MPGMNEYESSLSLSGEDYGELLRLAYLGEWLINAQHDGDHQDDVAQRALQRLMSAGEGTGLVRRDAETGQFFIEQDMADAWFDHHIADYDDHVFWDELIERVAVRDLAERRGVAPDTIERDDHLVELKPIEERYRQEFEHHGVERLEVVDED